MSMAVLRKTIADYRWLVIGVMGLLSAFVVLFMFATTTLPVDQMQDWLEVTWIKRFIEALMGADLADSFTPTGFAGFAFTHPMVWTLVLAFLLTVTSGCLSGEVDRGTMDTLATLPISRGRLYASLTATLVGMGLPLCASIWLGAWLGRGLVGAAEVNVGGLARVACHLYVAYLFLACFSLAVSAMCSRRTTALAISFTVIFYSFALNVLTAFWTPAKRIAFTGFLHYYNPLPILRDAAWRWGDIGVLLAAGGLAWTIGLVIFCRRDFPAR